MQVRGELKHVGATWFLALGPAWVRDNPFRAGDEVEVRLAPEGPELADDVRVALAGSPKARQFFEILPTYYRKNYIRWIEDAKRPETRSKRIAETVELFAAGRRERV